MFHITRGIPVKEGLRFSSSSMYTLIPPPPHLILGRQAPSTLCLAVPTTHLGVRRKAVLGILSSIPDVVCNAAVVLSLPLSLQVFGCGRRISCGLWPGCLWRVRARLLWRRLSPLRSDGLAVISGDGRFGSGLIML